MKQKLRFPRAICLLLAACCLFAACGGKQNPAGDPAQTAESGGSGGENAGSSGNPAPNGNHTSEYLAEVLKLYQNDETPVVADSLVIGSEASENAHALTLNGAEKRNMIAATGTRKDSYAVVSFGAKGDSAAFTFHLSAPVPKNAGERIWFEVEEIHEETEQGFAYFAVVNGKTVYYRTYEQIASAPNHYFFSVARSEIADLSAVSVRFVSDCNAPFAISRVWAYTNFSELTEEQGIYSNLGVNIYSVESTSTATDRLKTYGNYNYRLYDIGAMFRLNYMVQETDAILTNLESFLTYAKDRQIPVQFMNSVYWSSSPYGPDGQGGNFGDTKYTQILYNSATGEYYRSTPNNYSSTNWLTSGNDTLNNACAEKIGLVFSQARETVNKLLSSGLDAQNVTWVMEWGVCYKGISSSMSNVLRTAGISANPLDGGDFNPALVAKAAADGVALDPTDGLSYAEKHWLMDWTAQYNQALAEAYWTALGTDPVTVKNGTVTTPTAQTAERLFSHNVQWVNQNPARDMRISGWKGGVGSGFYSSSEDMYFDDIRYYQYKTAYGRTGCVNLEMAIHSPATIIANYLKQSYAAGLEFVTLFNDEDSYGTAATLKSIDNIDSQAADAPTEYRVNLLNVDFLRDAATPDLVGKTEGIVSVANMEQDSVNGLLSLASAGTGSVTFRVSDGGRAFQNGLTIGVQAASVYGDSIKIYVGKSADSTAHFSTYQPITAVDRFNSNFLSYIDLTSATKGLTECYIKLEFTSANKTAALQFMKVYLNNSAKTGQTDGTLPTMKEQRIQNLWVSRRAVVMNEYERYLKKNGGETDAVSELALQLIENGSFAKASELLCGQISELLPAVYSVTGGGTLGRYPVSLEPSRAALAVTVTLLSFGENGLSMQATSARAQDVTFTVSELPEGSRWTLQTENNGLYTLRPAANGETDGVLTASNGKVEFTVAVQQLSGAKTYRVVEGRVSSAVNGTTLRVTVQDPAVSQYAESNAFTLANSVTYTRRADGSDAVETGAAAMPKAGDYVKLTFDAAGQKVVKVESVYGQKTGVIQTFIKPDQKNGVNGTIVFADGSSFELEYGKYTTKVTIGSTDAYLRTLFPSQIEDLIREGMSVSITYCPESYGGATRRILTISA